MGTGSFPGVKSGRGVTLTPHPLLVPWSWKGKAIPLLPLWAVRPVQTLSACTRVHSLDNPPPPHYSHTCHTGVPLIGLWARSCHGMFRWMHAFCDMKLPCSGTRCKAHAVLVPFVHFYWLRFSYPDLGFTVLFPHL